MKNWFFLKRWFGVAVASLPLAAGCQSETTNSPPVESKTVVNTPVVVSSSAPVTAPAAATLSDDMAAEPPPADLENAQLKPVGGAQAMPVSVRATSPTAEIIRMANAGVSPGVMLTFVTNSTSTFNLGADEIIYLNDIGVSSEVVTAMIQHDQALKANAAAALNASVPVYTAPTNPPPAPTLAPEQVAPQAVDTGIAYPAEPVAAPSTVVTYPTFYSSLSPYGTWMEIPGYGTCWQPTVVVLNAGWSPYVDCGRWMYSDWGWYWYSDYSWGWAPFHYGRWFHHHNHGWCWVPGRTWGPAWVSWRYTDTHCGWAPLPPGSHFSVGIGWSFGGRHVGDDFHFGLHEDRWHFVPTARMQDRHVGEYAMRGTGAAAVYRQSVVANRMEVHNNHIVNRGVGAERVEAATRSTIRPVTIRPVTSPTAEVRDRGERLENSGKRIDVYRPAVTSAKITPRPADTRMDRTVYRGSQQNLEARETIEPLGNRSRPPARQAATSPSVLSSPKAEAAPATTAAPGTRGGRSAPPAVTGTPRTTQPAVPTQTQRPSPPAVSTAPAPSRPSAPSYAPTATAPVYRSAPPAAVTTSPKATPGPSRPTAPPAAMPSAPTSTPRTYTPSAPSTPRYSAPPAAVAPQRSAPAPATPSYRPTTPSVPRYSAPPAATAPQRSYSAPAAPSYTPTAPSVPRYSAPPAATAPQRSYSAPAVPSYTPSAPSVPRYSAPSQPSYSAPAARSAPVESRSYSAPAPAPQRSYSPPPSSSQGQPSRSESSGSRAGGRNQNPN